jgi:hypothetical protein
MPTLRSVLSLVGICLAALCTHAGELEDRNAIRDEFAEAFDRSDFALIESRYARAIATEQRLGSGQLVANQTVRYMFGLRQGRGDDAYWSAVEEKTRAWGAQFPKSVLQALALSRAHEQHAWAHRGGGYASTVSEDRWKQFRLNMDLARQALLDRADVGTKDPNWWHQLLMLAWAQSWPEERYWEVANAAMNAFPQNPDIYSAISRRLLPQWGGSWAVIADFAGYVVKRTRAVQGQMLYARIYWHLQGYLEPGLLASEQVDWPKIRAGFEDLVARYPDNWNLNHFARFACDAGDKATAQRLLGRIEDSVIPSAWANKAMYNRCRNWAAS